MVAIIFSDARDGLAEGDLLYPHGSPRFITKIDSAAGMNDPLCGRVTLIFDGLREIQHRFGYLPAEELKDLAKKIDVPLYRLHGVASFYPHFRLTPPPKADVCVCQDMSCHLRGADGLRARLEERLQNLSSSDVIVRGISCLGRCNEAPAVAVNDRIYTRL